MTREFSIKHVARKMHVYCGHECESLLSEGLFLVEEWPGFGGSGRTAEMSPGDKCRARDPENQRLLGSVPKLHFKPTFQIRFAAASVARWGIWGIMDSLYSTC